MKDRKFILKTLAKNKPNYIFTSIVSPDTQVSLYCGYLYEQERVLIDLDAYEKV
jgi:hypothetical protein